MESMQEISLVVPADLVRTFSGLAMDSGGSVTKAVFRSEENLKEVANEDTKLGHLQMMVYSRSQLKDSLEYLAGRVSFSKRPQPISMYATGLGCTEHKKLIAERLNVKVENRLEFECFVKAFRYLAENLSRADFFEPYLMEAGMAPIEDIMQQKATLNDSSDHGVAAVLGLGGSVDPEIVLGQVVSDSPLPVTRSEPDLYPCILAMCGSAFGFMQINADGKFKMVDGSFRGGKTFYGLGCLLTGCQSFDELLQLASKGNPQNVDMFTDAIFENKAAVEEDESSLYSQSLKLKPSLLYCFGKCAGSKIGDFKREDIARSLLNLVIQDVVQTVVLSSVIAGVKRICFCGNFVNSLLVRSILTSEMVKRNIMAEAMGKYPVKFDFVKHGVYLGAIGALVSHFEDISVEK